MSNINPQNIDGTFPIAGQDNNSQGFRDNFTNTINNFTFAAAELSDLQTYAVVTGPLTSVGQTGTPTNNMNYTYLTKPQLLGAVETSKNVGNIATSGTIQVDWSQGHYQTVGATGSVSLSFTSTWPTTSLYTKLRLQIKAWGTTTIALDPKVSVNVNTIQGVSANVLTLSDGVYAFEFATSDAGATISIRDLWRNYNVEIAGNVGNFVTANISGNLAVGGNIITYAGSGANLVLDPDGTGDVVLTSNTNLWVLDTTSSTNTTSGALINYGGAGIAGNVNIGGNLTVAGDSTFNGNVIRAGAQIDSGYQYYAPSANTSITANVTVSRLILDPTVDALGIVLTLPGGNVDAKVLTVSSTANIAGMQFIGSYGTTVSPSVNVAIPKGTQIQFFYHAVESKWYKVG